MAIKYTEQQIAEVDRLARLNCNNNTIAEITGIPASSLKRRFNGRLTRGRALWREDIRQAQANNKDNPTMAIWLGKQDLGQTDKQVIETGSTEAKAKTGAELDAIKAASKAYNESMSRSGLKLRRGKDLKAGGGPGKAG